MKGVTPDVLDEHFYMSAAESFSQAHHYDAADRKGPKIFVGEWATREGDPTPNLEAALADAAWLTGLERNSDLIIMASYAPLFVNVNPGGMQWAPDLIGYDALSSYGSPSYWTQVMFSTHLGTEVVASTLANAPARVFASVTRDEGTHKLFVKVVNATSTAQPLRYRAHRRQQGRAAGHAHYHERQNAQCDQHHRAIPKPSRPSHKPSASPGPKFSHTFAPYSINVLELSY